MTTTVTMAVRPKPQCVQFVHYEIVHRAAIAMSERFRKYEVWQYEFERTYNVRFGTLKSSSDTYTVIFPSDED